MHDFDEEHDTPSNSATTEPRGTGARPEIHWRPFQRSTSGTDGFRLTVVALSLLSVPTAVHDRADAHETA